MSTLQDLTSKFRDYIKSDPNDKIWSTSQKTNAINVGYFQVQKDGGFRWPENEAVATFSTAGGTQEYSLTASIPGFIRLDLVQFVDTAGDITPYTKQAAMRLMSGRARPSSYYLFSGKIGFYPTPDTAYQIQVLYRKRLTTMTAAVDSAFSEDYDDAIVMYAAYKIWGTTKNSGKTSQALQDYNMAVGRLKMAYLYQDTASLSFPFQSATTRRSFDPKILT